MLNSPVFMIKYNAYTRNRHSCINSENAFVSSKSMLSFLRTKKGWQENNPIQYLNPLICYSFKRNKLNIDK
jgi:hypothetical protein